MKRDKQLTEMMGFTDKRSYMGQRIHPNTKHQCQYLFGDDVTQVRRLVFDRERGRCWNCGAYYGWDYGHLRHIVGGRGLQRCFCLENLGWGCPKCHSREHVRVKWTPKKGSQ